MKVWGYSNPTATQTTVPKKNLGKVRIILFFYTYISFSELRFRNSRLLPQKQHGAHSPSGEQ